MVSKRRSEWRQVWTSFVGAVPGLMLLGLVAWGLIALVGAIISYVQALESNFAAALIAAAAAVVGSVVSLTIGKAYETRAAIRSALRQKKTPVYEDIVKTLYEFVFAASLGKKHMDQKKLMHFIASTTEKLTIWGSDEVLRCWSEFKTNAGDGTDGTAAMFRFEEILLKIRKDLGHRNRGIGRTSILRLFVTDLDEHLGQPGAGETATGAALLRGSEGNEREAAEAWSDPGTWVTDLSGHMGDTCR